MFDAGDEYKDKLNYPARQNKHCIRIHSTDDAYLEIFQCFYKLSGRTMDVRGRLKQDSRTSGDSFQVYSDKKVNIGNKQ